jgi:DNA-binding LacI/PurR family transcriptional regulator
LVLIAPPVDIFRHPIEAGDAPVVLCAAAPPAYADTWASAGAVTLDNKSAMEKLVNHVVVKGCKRLLHLAGQPDIYESHERSDLFIESAKEHKGVTTEVVQGAWTGELAEGVVHDYLETHRTWPDCILCFNDDIALGCLKTLRRKGIGVPSPIAVTGWDDIPFSDFADLTTVHLPMHEMGWEVGKILFERIESTDLKRKIKPPSMLEMPLKIRGSTALLPGTRQQENR